MTMIASNLIQPLTAYPKPGVYDAPHMITLLCAIPGADIHYTLDGSTPMPASPRFDPYRVIPPEQFGQAVEIIPTATSRRYTALTSNGSVVRSGQAFQVALNDDVKVCSIKVVAPDGATHRVYSLTATKGA